VDTQLAHAPAPRRDAERFARGAQTTASTRLERGDPVTLAALAVELGYSDQAHLANDFRNAVGKAPSEFAQSVHR
jgi:AraC-like DNA-binding protein